MRFSGSDTESKLQHPRPVTDKGIKQFVLCLLRALHVLRGEKKGGNVLKTWEMRHRRGWLMKYSGSRPPGRESPGHCSERA